MASSTILRAENITKTYLAGEVEVHALRGVDMSLFAGEFVVLLGVSGSGKSTLLNILGGLDTPSSGEVWYQNQRIDEYTESELTQFRREHIGFIFQMYNLIPRLTAKENVELVTDLVEHPLESSEALKVVGLQQRMHHFPSQMSGGEQQRVAIARAIAKRPRLLFCDEPTGALDLKTGVLVLEAIQNASSEFNTTTVVITHNQSIARMADRIVYLKDGQIERIEINKNRLPPAELQW